MCYFSLLKDTNSFSIRPDFLCQARQNTSQPQQSTGHRNEISNDPLLLLWVMPENECFHFKGPILFPVPSVAQNSTSVVVNWRSYHFHDQRACCVISKRTCAHLWVHGCVGHKMSCGQGECECIAILRQQKQLCHGPKKKHGLKWHSKLLHLREFFWIPAAPIDGLLACFHFAREQIRSNSRKRFTSPTWRMQMQQCARWQFVGNGRWHWLV